EDGVVAAARAPAHRLSDLKALVVSFSSATGTKVSERSRCAVSAAPSLAGPLFAWPLCVWLLSDIADHVLDDAGEFRGAERQPADPVVGDDIDEVAPAQHQGELPQVDLGHQDLVVGGEHFAEVGRDRGQVPQLTLGGR